MSTTTRKGRPLTGAELIAAVRGDWLVGTNTGSPVEAVADDRILALLASVNVTGQRSARSYCRRLDEALREGADTLTHDGIVRPVPTDLLRPVPTLTNDWLMADEAPAETPAETPVIEARKGRK